MGKLAKILPVIGPIADFLGPAGQILSAFSTAQSVLDKPKKAAAAPSPAQAPPFSAVRPDAAARPGSLTGFSDFTPEQERSALATRGINQGLGKDEENYYKNLVQRSLIGEGNAVAGDTNTLLPVESQYFSQKGMNTSGIMDFLKQLAGAQ